MQLVFPLIPVLIRIAAVLPRIVADVSAEVQADKAATSDGGEKLTGAELGVIIGHVAARLGEAILPTVAKANGIKL
jgi:hypothetical protein